MGGCWVTHGMWGATQKPDGALRQVAAETIREFGTNKHGLRLVSLASLNLSLEGANVGNISIP